MGSEVVQKVSEEAKVIEITDVDCQENQKENRPEEQQLKRRDIDQ